jgi:hypothetical protein
MKEFADDEAKGNFLNDYALDISNSLGSVNEQETYQLAVSDGSNEQESSLPSSSSGPHSYRKSNSQIDTWV